LRELRRVYADVLDAAVDQVRLAGISNTVVVCWIMIPRRPGLWRWSYFAKLGNAAERRFHAAIPALFAGSGDGGIGTPHSIAVTVALLGICSGHV